VEAETLREQSALCRRLAEGVVDQEIASRLLKLADCYERQASEAHHDKPNN
jgi:hypothetical protein